MPPWNDWYHCMGNTYGTWLPGDERGYRTHHHKQHVPFDYKHRPPPGTYDNLLQRSKRLMTRPPVVLKTWALRQRALDEFVASLLRRDIPLAIASVDRVHFHALARFADHNPRHWIGVAKKESSHHCTQANLAAPGGLWAAACECKPVAGPDHWHAARDYIADHARRGAAVWRADARPPLWDLDPDDPLVG